MKNKILLLCCLLGGCFYINAQNVGIGIAAPHTSAELDISSTARGLLIPRMTATGITAIASPAKGLMVYDSLQNQLMVNMGTPAVPNWQTIALNSGWGLSGNSGTNPAIQFIGNTDNQPLRFRVNNSSVGELNPVSGNIFWGLQSGIGTTTGYSNIALGKGALKSNTTRGNNVAIGDSALYNNGNLPELFHLLDGNVNTAVGSKALYANTSGYGNTANGAQSLFSNTTGQVNTAVGYQAMYTNQNGIGNAAVGYQSLYSNTSGVNNTAIGGQSLLTNTSGESNTAIGAYSLRNNKTGSSNTAVGSGALNSNIDGNYNSATGVAALSANTSGFGNTASGSSALATNTNGYGNTATGSSALNYNTSGSENTATGGSALFANVSGSQNIATGTSALLSNTTGGRNIAVGYESMIFNTTGGANIAVGYGSLRANIAGIYNTAVGYGALQGNNGSLGNYNTALGNFSLQTTTNSQYNTVVGYNAGSGHDMGYNNTLLGANCDVTANGLFNCIAIGQQVTCTASSQARIGNLATNSIGGTVSWSTLSDGRYKLDLQENVKGIDFIMKLRPLTYHLNLTALSTHLDAMAGRKTADQQNATARQALTQKESTIFSGFVAQEVEQAAAASGYAFSGVDKPQNENDLYGLRYADFVVPLVKGMQDQQQMIKDMKKRIDALEEQNKLLLQLIKNKN